MPGYNRIDDETEWEISQAEQMRTALIVMAEIVAMSGRTGLPTDLENAAALLKRGIEREREDLKGKAYAERERARA